MHRALLQRHHVHFRSVSCRSFTATVGVQWLHVLVRLDFRPPDSGLWNTEGNHHRRHSHYRGSVGVLLRRTSNHPSLLCRLFIWLRSRNNPQQRPSVREPIFRQATRNGIRPKLGRSNHCVSGVPESVRVLARRVRTSRCPSYHWRVDGECSATCNHHESSPWEVAHHAKNVVVGDFTDTCLTPCDDLAVSCPNEGQDKLYLGMEQPRHASLQSRTHAPISVVICGEGIYRRGTIISLSEKSSIIGSRRGTTANMGGDAKMMSRRSTLLCGHLLTTSRRGTFASCAEAGAMPPDVAPDLNELRARRGTMLSVAESLYASNKVSGHSIAADTRHTRRATVVSISNSCRLEASSVRSDSLSLGIPTTRAEVPSPPSLLRNVIELFKNPRFYFHALSFVSWGFFVDCFLTVVFDFAKDAGLAQADTVYALTVFSATDTVGRLFVPFLSDGDLISNCGLLTIAYLTLGLLQQAAPYVRGKQGVWALAGAFGLPAGYIMVGASQIMSAEVGLKNLPIAYGFMSMATAVPCLVRPFLIGFFRDNHGSYNGMFRLIGGMLGASFLFTLGLWIAGRSRKRKVTKVIPDASIFTPEPLPTVKEENTDL
ncbi:uncharacterized protein LOC142574302 isoform X1 [Dermacentor variabilis]|uniref:uncharacterized protein LOC142574302 isoform X1 n=1 Tax=Dermacentor variabilis TaxID=34621 RepID=UPI003F5BC4F7